MKFTTVRKDGDVVGGARDLNEIKAAAAAAAAPSFSLWSIGGASAPWQNCSDKIRLHKR